jgi:hypothetical protein
MKSIRRFALSSLVLALFASCLGAASARAQEFAGKFTLPFEARWGAATLPAGDYTFTIDEAMAGGALVVSSAKVEAIVRGQAYNPKATASSALILRRENGVYAVRELRMSDLGVVLYYGHPRPKHVTATQEREMASVLPVTRSTAR